MGDAQNWNCLYLLKNYDRVLMDSCNFPTEEIMSAQKFNLHLIYNWDFIIDFIIGMKNGTTCRHFLAKTEKAFSQWKDFLNVYINVW